jgi:hypothetical protein
LVTAFSIDSSSLFIGALKEVGLSKSFGSRFGVARSLPAMGG